MPEENQHAIEEFQYQANELAETMEKGFSEGTPEYDGVFYALMMAVEDLRLLGEDEWDHAPCIVNNKVFFGHKFAQSPTCEKCGLTFPQTVEGGPSTVHFMWNRFEKAWIEYESDETTTTFTIGTR